MAIRLENIRHSLGAKLIRVYGADMKGTDDFAGGKPRLEHDRDEDRWGLEWAMWDFCAHELRNKHKVDLCRIL